MIAAAPGVSFADPYVIGLMFAGVAVFAAVGALSHQQERAFSASLVYLVLGSGPRSRSSSSGLGDSTRWATHKFYERAAELAVIVALFGTGLKLERELRPAAWSGVGRLLLIAMPLTIVAVAVFGTQVMGLSLGAAIVLAARARADRPGARGRRRRRPARRGGRERAELLDHR